MTTNVLIVEHNPKFIRHFSDAVLADPHLRLFGTISTARAAMALIDAQSPDVILIDLRLPDVDGTEVIRHVAKHHPACGVLVMTMPDDDQRLKASIDAGASGFLLKDAGATDIATAIRDLHAGGSPISPSIARKVLASLRGAKSVIPIVVPETGESSSPLSHREREVLRLTAKGLNFGTIGDLLGISPSTVDTHAKRIYRKLAVHSRGEAVYEAYQMGWL